MPKPIPYMTKLILHPPQHISHKPHPHKFALHPYKKPTSLTAPQRNKKTSGLEKTSFFQIRSFGLFGQPFAKSRPSARIRRGKGDRNEKIQSLDYTPASKKPKKKRTAKQPLPFIQRSKYNTRRSNYCINRPAQFL